MKRISIKVFALSLIFIFLLGESFIFYSFYKESKQNIATLLKSNIQSQINNLQHYINSNNVKDDIKQIVSHLDNTINANILFDDMHIITDDKQLVYSTDRDMVFYHPSKSCVPIAKINFIEIFQQGCYTFTTKEFRGLTPHYNTNAIYVNITYIDSLLNKQIEKFTFLFIIFITLFSIIGWFMVNKVLINPLEALRRFAYYSRDIPKQLFIQELESIRYSLRMTFNRLQHEQDELYKLSTKDALSGLYNRHSLIEKINWLISKSKRADKKFALLFIDLDNFKNINDSMGHDYGDIVLKHVAKILLESVRDNDLVSRLGGDEFVILLPDIEEEFFILEVLQRVKEKLSKPIDRNDFKSQITASIGIAIFPKDGQNVIHLLKNADIAMYKAKELGKNNYHFFTSELDEAIHEKMQMHQYLLEALENDYFELYYQPKVDVARDKIVACEALIRLNHPKYGLIPPDKFILLAEKTGLIVNIGKWIIDQAVHQIDVWSQTPLKDIVISINVSGIQLQDKKFIEYLSYAIQNIDTTKLDIELTESVLIFDFDNKLKMIYEMKNLGLTLSLDDFGTGYSSLSYLKTIPFDILKIDKIFIDDIDTEDGKSFIEMILKIAQTLQIDVVAEGVETKEQLDYLKEMQCDIYQGYYKAKPLVEKEFRKLYLESLDKNDK